MPSPFVSRVRRWALPAIAGVAVAAGLWATADELAPPLMAVVLAVLLW